MVTDQQRQVQRFRIAGLLFESQTKDVDEIKRRIKGLSNDEKTRLKGLVDWVEDYENSEMKG
jgi:hypothetical protein